VDVIAYKNGERYEAGDIEVKVVEYEGGVTICAVYPTLDRIGGECLPGDGSNRSSRNNDVSVDFIVHVPKGVKFLGRTVNGLVEAKSLDADAEAHTVNGDVRLSTTGAAQGETVNGSIVASVGKVTSPLKFSTVNGGITLEVPAGASAKVHADTLNGTIRADFPLTGAGEIIGKHVEGVIGRGGPELRIAAVNGSISLRRSVRKNF